MVYIFTLFCLLFTSTLHVSNVTVQQAWVIPDKRLRFDQVCYLCSHNAYANKEEGFKSHQQETSIKKQMNDHGVRSLMLDTWWFQGDVYLCHEDCGGKGVFKKTGSVPKVDSAKSFFKSLGNLDDTIKASTKSLKAQFGDDLGYKKFNKCLNEVCDFLDQNPQEVISIILQNETSSEKVWNVIKKNKRARAYLLTPNDWNPYEQHEGIPLGGWPTLEELQKRNKRLIIFDSKPEGEALGMYYQWFYTFENWYNTNSRPKICQQRDESKLDNAKKVADGLINKYTKVVNDAKKIATKDEKNAELQKERIALFDGLVTRFTSIKNNLGQRQLTVINNFKPGQAGKDANTYKALTKLFNDCGGSFPKNYPNFLALDDIEDGNPIEYVNMVNKQNAQKV